MKKSEKAIILAAIHLNRIDCLLGYVPDYEILDNNFGLSAEKMREIRDFVQNVNYDLKSGQPN